MANMAKLEEIMKDEANIAAFKACETEEAALAFLNSKGAEMTAEELKAVLPGDEVMDLDQMDAVAGGGIIDSIKNLFNVGINKQSPEDVMKTQQQKDGSTLKFLRNGSVRQEMLDENGNGRVIEYESYTAYEKVSDYIVQDGERYATPKNLM